MYDFSTLNDKELELLVCDLLNAKYDLNLQSFKTGRDGGIDLRYSTPKNDNSIVVQVKHYLKSGYNQLKNKLINEEAIKIKKLNPQPSRYIIATSLSLSPHQKDEIKNTLSPFVISSNDVITGQELNTYLREFPEIEKSHFKLWFSSLAVLNAILNNAIENKSQYYIEKIQIKTKLFVTTNNINQGFKKLKKEKLLFITGQPGIGKTTLAEMLILRILKQDFKFYKIEDIEEADNVLSRDKDEKQLFYFDDFLGSNYLKLFQTERSEEKFCFFVERVKNTPNKLLILSTRTIILNSALKDHEKLNRLNIYSRNLELELRNYSRFDKAKILYNHLFFRDIKPSYFKAIIRDKFYLKVVDHKNYTPRIIEFITDNDRIDNLSDDEYIEFINNSLGYPQEIWKHAYTTQIGYFEQILLITLFTFQKPVKDNILFNAFKRRLNFEKENHNQIIKSNQFDESIKVLLNGFLSHNVKDIEYRLFEFLNPSINDFFISYIKNSSAEVTNILSSIEYIEQLEIFKNQINLDNEQQELLKKRIVEFDIDFEGNKSISISEEVGLYIDCIYSYCKDILIDNEILFLVKKLNFEDDWYSLQYTIGKILKSSLKSSDLFNYIKSVFIEFISCYMNGIDDFSLAFELYDWFNKYKYDYNDLVNSNDDFFEIISDMIVRVLEKGDFEIMESSADYYELKNIDEVHEIYEDVYWYEDSLKDRLISYERKDEFEYEFGIDGNFWDDIIEENIRNSEESESLYDDDYYKELRVERYDEENRIDNLFS